MLGTVDRKLALRVGRALEAQRFFHDVNYENRLVDDIIEIYQFNELLFHGFNNSSSDSSASSGFNTAYSVTSTIISDYYDDEEEDDEHSTTTTATTATAANQDQHRQQGDEIILPNGVYTELTHCYTPTCSNNLYPCYSYTCPKKERMVKKELRIYL